MIGYVKALLAVLAAAFGGYVFGIWTTVQVADPVPAVYEASGWVSQVELLSLMAGAGAAVTVLAWGYIDYKYVVKA